MRSVVLALTLLGLFTEPLAADNLPAATFKVAIYYPQVPPYMYKTDETSTVEGLIPDVFRRFFKDKDIKLIFVEENRARAEQALYEGKLDAMVLNAKWSQHQDKLLFSVPVITHRDYIYTLHPEQLAQRASLNDKAICLRRNYVYSGLQHELETGALARVDADSEFDQMNMLVNGRCDVAYMNEHVAQWLSFHHFNEYDLYKSNYIVDEVGLTIALTPKWQALLVLLNQHIVDMQQRGEMTQLLQQHIDINIDVDVETSTAKLK